MDPIVTALSHYGLPGAILAFFAAWVWKKDAELKAERDARIADAKAYNDQSLRLQSQVLEAVNRLSLIFDEIRKGAPRRGI